MTDYSRLYHILFNGISEAIEILQDAQRTTEDIFMNFPDMLSKEKEDEDNK